MIMKLIKSVLVGYVVSYATIYILEKGIEYLSDAVERRPVPIAGKKQK